MRVCRTNSLWVSYELEEGESTLSWHCHVEVYKINGLGDRKTQPTNGKLERRQLRQIVVVYLEDFSLVQWVEGSLEVPEG